jgi:hypothetical protein
VAVSTDYRPTLFYAQLAAHILAKGAKKHLVESDLSEDYAEWLQTMFPRYASAPLADHHHCLWRWIWALKRGVRPRPLCLFLARGGAKSTSAELACVAIGAHDQRRYVLYVSGKQDQADDHVGNIARMLESDTVATHYPRLGERQVGKYGNSQGWRRNRIRTTAGLTVDALGLDVAARGVKLDEQRPDLIIFDDVDDTEDTIATVEKKVRAITQKLLPAGSPDLATLFVQNLVHYESVAARLAGVASVEADFLADREVIGPIPALIGFKAERVPGTIRHRIVSGVPTWVGQDRDTCQFQLNDWGIKAFRSEAQHERTPPEGQAFPEWDASVHVIPWKPIPASWPRYRAVDYGYAVPYCCLWAARQPDGAFVVYRESYGAGLTAPEQAFQVRALSAGETYKASVGDPSMWASTREGRRFKSVADQYKEHGVKLTKANNDRAHSIERIHSYLAWDEGDAMHDAFPPRLFVLNTCTNLIRTFPLLVKDANDPEDVDSDGEDHPFDALRYFLMSATKDNRFGAAMEREMVSPADDDDTITGGVESPDRNDPPVEQIGVPVPRRRLKWPGEDDERPGWPA